MKKLITINDLADRWQVPRSWIYQRTHSAATDRIPFIKVGRLLRFDEEEVELWLAKRQPDRSAA